MIPRLLINPQTATFADLLPVARTLMEGGLIACPTASSYALVTLVDNDLALERVLELKGEGRKGKPILLLIDQVERVRCYAWEVPEAAQELMDCFWPGPLTLLFLAHQGLHPSLLGVHRTVGLRVGRQPFLRRLVRMVDRGLTGTSANPADAPAAITADEVEAYFGNKLDLIVDGGTTAGGQPSTIVDVSLGPPRILREGALALKELIAACPLLRFKS